MLWSFFCKKRKKKEENNFCFPKYREYVVLIFFVICNSMLTSFKCAAKNHASIGFSQLQCTCTLLTSHYLSRDLALSVRFPLIFSIDSRFQYFILYFYVLLYRCLHGNGKFRSCLLQERSQKSERTGIRFPLRKLPIQRQAIVVFITTKRLYAYLAG